MFNGNELKDQTYTCNGKRESHHKMVLVKLIIFIQKNINKSIFINLHKLKSTWIIDLNIKPDTMKLIEEKIGKSLEIIGTADEFLTRALIKQTPITNDTSRS